jgi:uncharacterized membrane protein YcaP (DUF421 family)
MAPLLDIVIRSAVVYLFVLIGLRILGKRHVAQLSIVDLVLILLISNAVQNAMVGGDSSIVGGIVAAGTLILLNYIITIISFKFRKIDVLLEGTPTLLIHNGRILQESLMREKLTEEELERVIREHGIEKIEEVRLAIMELDGTVSVISKIEDEKKIETFKHRRTKYQQKKY